MLVLTLALNHPATGAGGSAKVALPYRSRCHIHGFGVVSSRLLVIKSRRITVSERTPEGVKCIE